MKVAIPQYITVEDKLLGLITFKQLFSLLGAFFLTYIMFSINGLLGFLTFIISFGSAIGLTFVKVNNQPFYKVLPSVIKLFLENKSFRWKMEKGIEYKEVYIPAEIIKAGREEIPERRVAKIKKGAIELPLIYKSPQKPIEAKIEVKLNEPLKEQFKQPEPPQHKHSHDPNNPYRVFPYVKLYNIKKTQ